MIYFAYIRNRNIKKYVYTEDITIFHEEIEKVFNTLDLTNYITRLDLLYSNIYCYEIDFTKQSVMRIDKTSNTSIDEYAFDNLLDDNSGSYEDLILGEISEILSSDLGLIIDLNKFKWCPDLMRDEFKPVYELNDRLDYEYFINGCLKASDDTYYVDLEDEFVDIRDYYGVDGYIIQKSKEHYDYSVIYLLEISGSRVIVHDIFSGYNARDAICIYKCCDEVRCLTVRHDIWHNDSSDHYWAGLYELLSGNAEIISLHVNINGSYCINSRGIFELRTHIDSYMRYSPYHRNCSDFD